MSPADDLQVRWVPSAAQDEAAFETLSAGETHVYTAHLLVNKEHGWWTNDVQVVHLPGIFADRDEASEAIVAAAKIMHDETGLPVTGGYTHHQLNDEPMTSADGTRWKTQWAVFEDIMATFPKPSWSRR